MEAQSLQKITRRQGHQYSSLSPVEMHMDLLCAQGSSEDDTTLERLFGDSMMHMTLKNKLFFPTCFKFLNLLPQDPSPGWPVCLEEKAENHAVLHGALSFTRKLHGARETGWCTQHSRGDSEQCEADSWTIQFQKNHITLLGAISKLTLFSKLQLSATMLSCFLLYPFPPNPSILRLLMHTMIKESPLLLTYASSL